MKMTDTENQKITDFLKQKMEEFETINNILKEFLEKIQPETLETTNLKTILKTIDNKISVNFLGHSIESTPRIVIKTDEKTDEYNFKIFNFAIEFCFTLKNNEIYRFYLFENNSISSDINRTNEISYKDEDSLLNNIYRFIILGAIKSDFKTTIFAPSKNT